MSENEIARIVNRLDSMEASRSAEMKEHEKEIRELVKSELRSFRTTMFWFMGIILTGMFAMMTMLTNDLKAVTKATDKNTGAIRILIGKATQDDPNNYILEDLDNEFNPKRGVQ